MDISSKYFPLLKRPVSYGLVLRHLWYFLLDIYRVGKCRELISFGFWEISHWLCWYRFADRYVKFTDDVSLYMTDTALSPTEPLTSSFLAKEGLCLRPVAIDWRYCCPTIDGRLWGVRFSQPKALWYSDDQSQSAILAHEFAEPITSFFVSGQRELFVCSNGLIYKRDNRGGSFTVVLRLSTTDSYFLFNNGMTELPDHTLLIGEYGSIWRKNSWQNLAFLYYSFDGGDTWQTADFLMRQGVNKHIHIVKYSTHLNALLLTDGDNKKQVWVNRSLTYLGQQARNRSEGWRLLTKYHHQTGGYLSMAETADAVLFGSDYLGGTNFIIRTACGRRFDKRVLPDPYRRSPVMNMVSRNSPTGKEIWAVSYNCLTTTARSLLMCTKDSGKSWARVIEFEGKQHEIRLVTPSQSAHGSLYVSITRFGRQPGQTSHQVYRLEPCHG